MDLYIDKYRNEDGELYIGKCYYEDEEGLIMTGILGFCGCGMPDECLKFLETALTFIKERMDMDYEVLEPRELEIFGSLGGAYFAYYVFDEKEITEHGGSVPGWLTELGENILSDIIKINKQAEA